MRERTFLDEVVPASVPNWYKLGSSWVINAPIDYSRLRKYSGMADVVTPRYSKLRNEGNLINNPMSRLNFTISTTPTIFRGKGDCGGGQIHEYELADFIPTTVNTNGTIEQIVAGALDGFSDESEIAQTKAWANIDVSEIQGSASLGELPETITFLRDSMKALAELLVAIRRKDIKRLKKILGKKVSLDGALDTWLQYRYAIRPLISDIMAALEALKATLEKGKRFTSRGRYSHSLPKTVANGVSFYYTNPAIAADFLGYYADVTLATERMFRAGVLVEIDSSIDMGMAIWGIDNPIEAIWELISLSFVVDWFFNIGRCLEAAFLNPGLTPKISWVTEYSYLYRKVVVTTNWRNSAAGCSANLEAQHLKQTGWLVEEYFFRRRIPLAKQYSLPHINVRLSPDKILDIFAIARKML